MFSSRRTTVPGIQPASTTVAFVLLLLASIWSPAIAGRNTAGAMVLHVDNAVTYSADVDYCSADPLPATCADLVTNVTKDPSVEALVWMVAAFPDNSSPGVTAFQVGIAGDVPADYYTAFAPCGPGVLEIPDATWPAPGTGTACAFGTPVYGQLFKMYWFVVTAPGTGSSISTTNYPNGDHHAEWADDSDPPLIDVCYNFGRVVWGGAGQNQCPVPPQSGACCFADGTCRDLLADDCGAAGGTFEGPGTSCATFQCPLIGACCFADGHCTVLTQAQCLQQGGTYRGTGTNCNPNPCPQPPTGACCFPEGYCFEETQAQCQQQGGSFQGNGSRCNPNPCSGPTGACCFTDGHCTILTSLQCQYQGGSYRGNGTTCDPNPCIGACCFADGHCTVLTRTQCQQQGGTYQGGGTSCTPNPCPQPTGACCFTDGHCTILTQALCQQQGGTYQGNGTSCTPNPCPQPTGACCFTDGHCTVLTQALCQQQGGTYQGNGTGCTPNPCPQPPTGACCFTDGHCTVLTQAQCQQQGGTYQGNGTNCTPNPCPQHPTGACCFANGSCSVLTQAECEQQCGTYQGDHTTCIPSPCTPHGREPRRISSVASRPIQFPLGGEARRDRPSRNANGAMVLHVDNTVCYSAGSDYCSTDPLPATCADLVTSVTRDPSIEAVIWMVAAFPDNSSPAVTAFQVGIAGDVPADYYTAFAPCGPGVLEIPDATWPAPGTGTACAFGTPVYDRLFKMYWLAVTAPGTGSSISTTNYPSGDQHAEWADDGSPPLIDYCDNFGQVVWEGAGQNQCPVPAHLGACCFPDGHCEVLDQTACTGVYQGDGTTCTPNPCPQQPTGACCFTDGHCTVLTQAQCQQQGGTYQGSGSSCTPNPCPQPTGACCYPTDCMVQTQADCQGTYLGDGVPCDPNPCSQPPTGACCFSDGHCTILTQAYCQQQGGSYQGDLSVCSPNPCPQPMDACCFDDGRCAVLTEAECLQQGGSYQGYGTTCDPNPCIGACCFVDGHCAVLTEAQCQQEEGGYQGGGTTCTPNPCPPAGACCFLDNHCSFVTQAVCQQQGGSYEGDESTCDPNPCTLTGACCFADGHCAVLTHAECRQQSGDYRGSGTTCDPNPCPQPGACCFADGHCTILTQPLCEQLGGAFYGAGTPCVPNPCPQPPTGACCLWGGQCLILTRAECQQQGGSYQGDNTTCDPNPCNPCSKKSHLRPQTPGQPTAFVPAAGPVHRGNVARDARWTDAPDVNGLIASSEQILMYGLESELANDFMMDYVSHITVWTGYWNNNTPCQTGIPFPGLNIRVYDDAGCVPGAVMYDVSPAVNETSYGCQSGGYPMFQDDMDVSFSLSGGNLYWLGAQVKDHPFPPQGGRLASVGIQSCYTVFKSAYFGYPDWTPVCDVFGINFDVSQALEGGATPTVRTTWGRIKGMYH